MIAVSSKGQSFATLARYLVAGRSGEEHDRVAWSAARNLLTDDPELAGKIMRATAEQSTRVRQPVYHLVLSFDPGDAVDRATMERVADRVLHRLGLAEHQAVYVSHRDRAHPHVHVLLNRVHPETGRVWDLSFDYRAVQEILRREERALGLREVPGRYAEAELARGSGHETIAALDAAGDTRPPSDGARHAVDGRPPAVGEGKPRTDRTPDDAFVARVRAHVPALRAAPTWGELEVVLAAHGLRLERERRVLTIADDAHRVTASRVAPDLALGRLETRLGVRYDAHLADRARAVDVGLVPTVPLAASRAAGSPAVADGDRPAVRVARQLETYETVSVLVGEHAAASHALSAARARLAQLDAAEARAVATSEAFSRGLAHVYRDPTAARAAFDQAALERGIDDATRTMRERPERFGALRATEHRRAFGLVRSEDDAPARRAALAVATEGRDAWRARAGVAAPAEVTRARTALPQAITREREARDAAQRRPGTTLLEQEIGRAVRQLMPSELEELRRLVTAPQFALAVKLRGAVKDVILGREAQDR